MHPETLIRAAILVLSVPAALIALGTSPAFNYDLREETVFGGWHGPDGNALYDLPDYLYLNAFSYLQADLLLTNATGGEDVLATLDTALARAQRAEELLRDSISRAPSDGRVWTALAWAESLQGKMSDARNSLLVSWELQPSSSQLAVARLQLAGLLLTDEDATPPEKSWMRRDIAALSIRATATLEQIFAENPWMRNLD